MNEHAQRIQTFYKQFIKSGDLVFDVGANVGERTEIFRASGARVVAVEPHPDCVHKLLKKFRYDPRVDIVPKALGQSEGRGVLITGECTNISSLSDSWVQAVKKSARFGEYKWDQSREVEIETLDQLVKHYGTPQFIKIDVEGFEHEVLLGLSSPVRNLSFEFHTEFLESTKACIRHLENLGPVKFTYSVEETMEVHPEWVSGPEVLQYLTRFLGSNRIYGDVYAQFG